MAPDPWLPLLAAARQLAQDIAERIQERNRCQRSGESSAKVNVAIRASLQSLREKIEQLRELLLRAVSARQITQLEGDRRQNLVDDLLTRHRQLEASYRNEGPEPDMSRDSTFLAVLLVPGEVPGAEAGQCHRNQAGIYPKAPKDSPWAVPEPGHGSTQDGPRMDPSHQFSHLHPFGSISILASLSNPSSSSCTPILPDSLLHWLLVALFGAEAAACPWFWGWKRIVLWD